MKQRLEDILLSFSNGKASLANTLNKIDDLYSKPDETLKDRQAKFTDELRPYIDEYGREMLNKFFFHWATPKSPKARLLPFEKQKSWNLKARLKTWSDNNKKYSIVNLLKK